MSHSQRGKLLRQRRRDLRYLWLRAFLDYDFDAGTRVARLNVDLAKPIVAWPITQEEDFERSEWNVRGVCRSVGADVDLAEGSPCSLGPIIRQYAQSDLMWGGNYRKRIVKEAR